jgi:hypothetical protein
MHGDARCKMRRAHTMDSRPMSESLDAMVAAPLAREAAALDERSCLICRASITDSSAALSLRAYHVAPSVGLHVSRSHAAAARP